MSGKRYVLDTNAIVAWLQGNSQITQLLQDANWVGISVISQIEYLAFSRLSEADSKLFLELTAIDLDVDSAFELAQMQRQLSRWHIHWLETWANDSGRLEISSLAQTWAKRIQQMAGVLV